MTDDGWWWCDGSGGTSRTDQLSISTDNHHYCLPLIWSLHTELFYRIQNHLMNWILLVFYVSPWRYIAFFTSLTTLRFWFSRLATEILRSWRYLRKSWKLLQSADGAETPQFVSPLLWLKNRRNTSADSSDHGFYWERRKVLSRSQLVKAIITNDVKKSSILHSTVRCTGPWS